MSSSSPHRTLERTPKPGAPGHCRRALVTGATGFIGARLAAGLAEAGWTVRCLVRDGSPARELEQLGFEVQEGAALRPETSRRAPGREIQIGGPSVLPYGEMLDRVAEALGRRPRAKLPVPLLSSVWIGLVTPVDAGVARPLIEGLSTVTIVTDVSGAELFNVAPMPFEEALRRAVADDDTTVCNRRAERREPGASTSANTTP
jgi:uncharacterized protein YbjT (DUF2867 family)